MNRNITKIFLPILIFAELAFCFFAYKSYFNKDIKEDKKVTIIDKTKFAIYKENDNGVYEKINDKIFPEGYKLNTEKTSCVDNKGNIVNDILSIENNELVLISNKTVFCYLYFYLRADIKINVSTDGKPGVLPTNGIYTNTLNCDTATAVYDNKYQRVKINSVTSDKVKCNLNFVKDTRPYSTLKTEVEDKTTKHIATIPDYTKAVTLNQNEYISSSQYIGTSYSSTSGTTVTNAFAHSGTEWSSVPANLTSNKYYHIKFNIPSEGYYHLCYTMSSGYSSNYLYAYKNTTQLQFGTTISDLATYLYASSSSSKSGCIDVGKLTTSDYIKVVQRAYSSGTGTSTSNRIATVSFYLKKTTEAETYDAGYRFSGKQPNNWVWFNNEKWRIIGSIPTKLSDGTTSNLVKIIRSESIGGLAYHRVGSNPSWGTNTLYDLLNNYYYGKKDATGADPCLGYNATGYSLCNYIENGISNDETDYYGRMIKNIYWNVGTVSNSSITIDATYGLETAKVSNISAKIGLMSASDYGYATSGITYINTSLKLIEEYTKNNWLYGKGSAEWTLTPSDTSFTMDVGSFGNIGGGGWSANMSFIVRPVVYLDSSVYIISGNGTEANPYQIGM